MSRYDQDRRVHPAGRGYTVTAGGTRYRVLPSQTLGWGIYTGPNLDLLPAPGGFAIGYQTADDAIGDLLGDPR